MRHLLWVVAVAVFFLNPSFACVDEPEFQYGAEEMRAAIAGDWSFTITTEGGSATEVTVHIDQGTAPASASRSSDVPLVRAANACGTRTLVKSAGACADDSQMPLAVSYVSGDAAFSTAALSGTFIVYGLTFVRGNLTLTLGSYQVFAGVNADGSIVDPHLQGAGAGGTVAITRL